MKNMQWKNSTVGIVGGGVVGSAIARTYLEHVKEVCVYDIDSKRATTNLSYLLEKSNVIFICLPTPKRNDGLDGLDTSCIEEFFERLQRPLGFSYTPDMREKVIVIRSTVPVGFTRTLSDKFEMQNICHSPEFLTARCSFADASIPSRNLIGNTPHGKEAARQLESLYQYRFPNVQLYTVTSEETEFVKLMANSFFAVKIAFFNEMYQLMAKGGSKSGLSFRSYQPILNMLLMDERISPYHTMVPGPDGEYGFGGACLPKDLSEVISYLNPTWPSTLRAAQELNQLLRKDAQ